MELGLSKNTSIWRPGSAFEGKTTKGGLPRGTIPDADEAGPGGYIVEIKGTTSLTARFQIRLEDLYAQISGRPLWVIAPKGAEVSEEVVARAERTGGGVLYRTGPNRYEDGNGNQVQVGKGMRVSGYQPAKSGGDPAEAGQTPGEPSAPVNPAPAGPGPAVPDPVEPDPDPIGPEDPIIEIP
jgi:hypothetical protein